MPYFFKWAGFLSLDEGSLTFYWCFLSADEGNGANWCSRKKLVLFSSCETIELPNACKMMLPFKATNIDKASLALPFRLSEHYL